jgi:nucleoside-diphosphate-sugar epimerase
MKVLFIGGTGLISTAIARQLLESGHEVTLYNRGKSENRVPDGAIEMQGDRKNRAEFEAAFEGKTYDVAVDMIAFSPDDTRSSMKAFKGRVGQFIHCSTVCVYSGPPAQIPTTETEEFHSIGGYGKAKIECEKLLFEAFETEKFPMTIMRPSHSYGEGSGVIRSFGPASNWLARLRAGKPIIVHGDGTSLWASCHVDDVARGFIGAMDNPKCIGEAYNITSDEWMTWETYHQQVAEVLGVGLETVHIPTEVLAQVAPDWSGSTREILAWTSIFDNSKIKSDTDYRGQTISWREGVKRNINWLERESPLQINAAEDEYEDQLIAAWREVGNQLPRRG